MCAVEPGMLLLLAIAHLECIISGKIKTFLAFWMFRLVVWRDPTIVIFQVSCVWVKSGTCWPNSVGYHSKIKVHEQPHELSQINVCDVLITAYSQHVFIILSSRCVTKVGRSRYDKR